MLLRNINPCIKSGTTTTQKGQETDYPFRKSSILCCSVIKFAKPFLSQFWEMKETNNKNSCCSQTQKYFCAAQKSLLLFCAVHWNKQKYFDAFSLLWDDTKSTNCPGIAMWLTYVEDTFKLTQGRLHLCLNLHSAKHLNNQTETTILSSHK